MSPFDIVKYPLRDKIIPSREPLVQRVHRLGVGGCRLKAFGGKCLVCNLLSKSTWGKMLAIDETR